jgi:hypothetical protein
MSLTSRQLWARFWDWLEDRPAPAFLFRGQADKSPIIPKIGRSAAARPFVPVPLRTDWEWLALAQHHGAPTRLADWSTSPLVAAWFAVTSHPETTDAAVFAVSLNTRPIETIDRPFLEWRRLPRSPPYP